MTLTTFKKLEESIIEDKDAVVESTMNDVDDDTEEIPPPKTVDTVVLEKQDSSPTAVTEPTVSLHTEN